ncbi:MAG: efflux RND transporter periplasmic adaptor subunit [Myxococcota bacterium]
MSGGGGVETERWQRSGLGLVALALGGLFLFFFFFSPVSGRSGPGDGLARTAGPGDERGAAGAGGEAGGVLPVATVRVELRAGFEVDERLAGRVVSPRRSALGFERAGRIAAILVDDGERVAAGAELARLDTRELEAQRRELAARVAARSAQLDLARATSGRQRELRRADYASQQRLDEVVANEKALEAQVAADRASLERVDVALELSRLRAPYAAEITARHVDEGTVASPGLVVLSIVETGVRELRIGVPPELADELEIGRRYAVEIDGGGEGRSLRTAASLRRVIATIDAATRTQTAVLALDDAEESTRGAEGERVPIADGALARVRFAREVAAPGAWVPIGALAEAQRGTWAAFAVVPDEAGGERVERRQVEVLHAESDRAYVRGTLRDGDLLVADGLHRLAPGLRVRRSDGRDGPIATPTASSGSSTSSGSSASPSAAAPAPR